MSIRLGLAGIAALCFVLGSGCSALRQEFNNPEKEKAAQQAAAKRAQVQRNTGIDAELNDTERGYLNDVRQKNRDTSDANAKKVFGGFQPR